MDADWCLVCDSKIVSTPDAVASSSAFCSPTCLLKAQSDARSRSSSPVLFPPGGGPGRSRRSTFHNTAASSSPTAVHKMAPYASAWTRDSSRGGPSGIVGPAPGKEVEASSELSESDDEAEDEGLQFRGRPRHRRFWDDSSEGGAPSLSTLNTSATDEGSGVKGEEDATVVRSQPAEAIVEEQRSGDRPSPGGTSTTVTSGDSSAPRFPFLSMSAPPEPPPVAQPDLRWTAASPSPPMNAASSLPIQSSPRAGSNSSASSSPTQSHPLSRRAKGSTDRLASFLASIGRPPSAPRGRVSSSHRHDFHSQSADDADVSEDLSAVADAFMAWGGVVSSSPSASISARAPTGAGGTRGDEVHAIHESVFRRHKERRPAPGRKAGVVSPRGWGLLSPRPSSSAQTKTITSASADPTVVPQTRGRSSGANTPVATFRTTSGSSISNARGRKEGRKDINRGTGDLLSRIEGAVSASALEGGDEAIGGRIRERERGRDKMTRRISSSGSRGRQASSAPGTAAEGERR